MNWLLKTLGYRAKQYRARDFSVRIEPIMREDLSVIYTRHGTSLKLNASRVGKKWEGIGVLIPQDVEGEKAAQIVSDLEAAFQSMGYRYVISRLAGVDIVDETERQASIAELREMGYDVEVSADRKWITQKQVARDPRRDMETFREEAPRMMSLIQEVHGTRKRFQILAKSEEP
jgi:hypothetical protein